MNQQNIFAERLKALRIEKNLKQDEVANALNVTKTQISDMERGKRTTTMEKLTTLADYFNVSTDYLLGRSDNPERH